jgi:hypothetical protein
MPAQGKGTGPEDHAKDAAAKEPAAGQIVI